MIAMMVVNEKNVTKNFYFFVPFLSNKIIHNSLVSSISSGGKERNQKLR